MEEKMNYYSTIDIGIASYLAYKGFRFTAKKEDGKPTIFIFDDGSSLIYSMVKGFELSNEAKLLAKFKEMKKIALTNYEKGFYNKK